MVPATFFSNSTQIIAHTLLSHRPSLKWNVTLAPISRFYIIGSATHEFAVLYLLNISTWTCTFVREFVRVWSMYIPSSHVLLLFCCAHYYMSLSHSFVFPLTTTRNKILYMLNAKNVSIKYYNLLKKFKI